VGYTKTAGGAANQSIQTFAIDPADPNVMFASNLSSVVRSTDGGCTWEKVLDIDSAPGGVPIDGIVTISVASHQRVYAVLGNLAERVSVLVSNDGGKTWTASQSFVGWALNHATLVPAPSNPDIAVLSYSRGGWFEGIPVVYITADGGKSWVEQPWFQNVLQGADQNSLQGDALVGVNDVRIAIDPLDARSIWGWLPGGRLFHSSDGGATWSLSSSGADPIKVNSLDLFHAPGGATHLVVYGTIGATTGVFGSQDGGGVWTELSLPQKDDAKVVGPTFFGSSPDSLLLTAGEAVYRYESRLQRWVDLTQAHSVRVGTGVYSSTTARPRIFFPSYGNTIEVFHGRT
jgi:photosystem II stability/assembly factor-like uncharacterized protein